MGNNDKSFGIFLSSCCKASYESVLTEEGALELRCTKCGKTCGILEEKYDIKLDLCRY